MHAGVDELAARQLGHMILEGEGLHGELEARVRERCLTVFCAKLVRVHGRQHNVPRVFGVGHLHGQQHVRVSRDEDVKVIRLHDG
jgi:hypothetical protein